MLKKVTLLTVCVAMLVSALPVHADTGPIQRLGTGIPTSIAASPDGKTLAVGSSIGVWFLDAATLTPNGFWDTGVWVNSVEYSRDGHYLKVNETVYDTDSGTRAGVDAGQVAWVNHRCTFDGTRCAQESDQVIFVVLNPKQPGMLIGDRGWIKDVSMLPDGKKVYGVIGGDVQAWELPARKPIGRLKNFFTGQLFKVIWLSTGEEIASGRSVWNVNSAQISRPRNCYFRGSPASVDCRVPEGIWWQYLGLQQIGVNKFLQSSRQFEAHHILVTAASMSADERFVATSGMDTMACRDSYYDCTVTSSSARVWDTQQLALQAELPTLFYSVALSADGQIVVGHTPSGVEAWVWATRQRIWFAEENIVEQCERYDYGRYAGWCREQGGGLAVSQSGYVASHSQSTSFTVRLYRLATGELVTTFIGHTAPITDIAFSPDGTKIAASSLDGTILIWDVP